MVWKGHKTILKIFNNVRGVQHFGQPRSLCAASNLSSQVTLYCKKSDVIDMMWAYNVSQDLPAIPPSSTYRFVGYSNFLLTGSVAAETNSFQKIAAKSTVHKVNTPGHLKVQSVRAFTSSKLWNGPLLSLQDLGSVSTICQHPNTVPEKR